MAIEIEYGEKYDVPKISEQLSYIGIHWSRLEVFDQFAHAISGMYLCRVITEEERDELRTKLTKKINLEIKAFHDSRQP